MFGNRLCQGSGRGCSFASIKLWEEKTICWQSAENVVLSRMYVHDEDHAFNRAGIRVPSEKSR
jgi:hypothetical protein